MKHKPVGLDIIMALGGGKHKASPGADEADTSDDGDSGLPPDFEQAWQDYHDHPSARAFWDAVEACQSGDKGSSKGY